MASNLFMAVYLTQDTLAVSGDFQQFFGENQRITAYQGVGGIAEATVKSIVYNDSQNRTEVMLKEPRLSSTLFRITLGNTYAGISSSNLCHHNHTSDVQGGSIPAASLTTTQLATLSKIPYLGTIEANRLMTVNADGGQWDLRDLRGTSDQVNVTMEEKTITLGLPQNIAATSVPTFAGMLFRDQAHGGVMTLSVATAGLNQQRVVQIVPVNSDGAVLTTEGGNPVFSHDLSNRLATVEFLAESAVGEISSLRGELAALLEYHSDISDIKAPQDAGVLMAEVARKIDRALDDAISIDWLSGGM